MTFSSAPEARSSARASSPCYGSAENVVVLSAVIEELELSDVERQILGADLVERADHAMLQDRPEAAPGLRIDAAVVILALAVFDAAMRPRAKTLVRGTWPVARRLTLLETVSLVNYAIVALNRPPAPTLYLT